MYEESAADLNKLAMEGELAMIDARLKDLYSRSDTGEAGQVWIEVKKTWREFQRAKQRRDSTAMTETLDTLDEWIKRGGRELVWIEIGNLIERRRKIVETEQKRQVLAREMVHEDTMRVFIRQLAEAARETVRDPDDLRALSVRVGQMLRKLLL